MDDKKKLYLAGPLGFSEPGRSFLYNDLIPALEGLGFSVLNPWDLTDPSLIESVQALANPIERKARWKDLNNIIASNNFAAIRECDLVVAWLDGTDVDSGTAAEMGYATALGKFVVGCRTDFRISGDNEGARINLQVEQCILEQGGDIYASLENLLDGLDLYLESCIGDESHSSGEE